MLIVFYQFHKSKCYAIFQVMFLFSIFNTSTEVYLEKGLYVSLKSFILYKTTPSRKFTQCCCEPFPEGDETSVLRHTTQDHYSSYPLHIPQVNI